MRPDNWITRIAITALALTTAPYTLAQDVQHGRISYADDDGLIRGSEDAEWSIARLNSLVMPGDTMLVVMPNGPSSVAIPLTRPHKASLAAM